MQVVGGDVFTECIRCIGGGGRLLVVGFASGTIPKIPINMVLIKGFSLVGVRSGQEMIVHPELTAEMIEKMNDICASNGDRTLAPVTKCVDYTDFRSAYKLILEKSIIGKACIIWKNEPQPKAKL